MDRERIEFRSDRVLLVEGSNDRDFFRALLSANGRSGIQVESYGGKTRLRARLQAIAAQADFQRQCRWLGVCRDCDESPEGAHQSLRDALKEAGLPAPRDKDEDEAGSVDRRVRIILLPHRDLAGELEDLVWQSLVAFHKLQTNCVESLETCLAEIGSVSPMSAKARVYAYLSTFNPPDRSLGSAALGEGVIPLDSPAFAPLLASIPSDDEVL